MPLIQGRADMSSGDKARPPYEKSALLNVWSHLAVYHKTDCLRLAPVERARPASARLMSSIQGSTKAHSVLHNLFKEAKTRSQAALTADQNKLRNFACSVVQKARAQATLAKVVPKQARRDHRSSHECLQHKSVTVTWIFKVWHHALQPKSAPLFEHKNTLKSPQMVL